MNQTQNQGSDAGPQLDTIKVKKIVVNMGNTYVRLAARDRRKVKRLIEKVIFKKADSAYYWDRWTKEEMQACYMQLLPISQKMANGWRRWASAHLKAGENYCLSINVLMDTLICRRWIEEGID
jgi:hypothetical protein